jgi:hypothetical protein
MGADRVAEDGSSAQPRLDREASEDRVSTARAALFRRVERNRAFQRVGIIAFFHDYHA